MLFPLFLNLSNLSSSSMLETSLGSRGLLSHIVSYLKFYSSLLDMPAIIKPTTPIPHIIKYIIGNTPSTIQKTIGKTTSPGAIKIASIMPNIPNHLLIATSQKINIRIPDTIYKIIPIIFPIALIVLPQYFIGFQIFHIQLNIPLLLASSFF